MSALSTHRTVSGEQGADDAPDTYRTQDAKQSDPHEREGVSNPAGHGT
jgi:hypothetical protein